MPTIGPKTLGILGGGQLAKLTTLAALNLGFRVHIYAQDPSEPACQCTSQVTIGDFEDIDKIKQFSDRVDFVTLENEFVSSEVLKIMAEKCRPSSEYFSRFEDKIIEKTTAKDLGIPCVDFQEILKEEDLESFFSLHKAGVLKLAKGGYDGCGNCVVDSLESAKKQFAQWEGRKLLIEEKLDFLMEASVIVASNGNEVLCYPVAETIQSNQICHFTIVPANISEGLQTQMQEYAKKLVTQLKGVGLFCFEFFITKEHHVLFNEMAPRPHNSGHLTMESSLTSQYQNLVRAVVGMPLGSTELVDEQNYVMVNLLGSEGPEDNSNIDLLKDYSDVSFYLYGKAESRKGRKMGPATGRGRDREALLERLQKLKDEFSI